MQLRRYMSNLQDFGTEGEEQALCFTHHVPARRVAPAAPVRVYSGRCSILEKSESWALYDSLPMTRTDGSTHDSIDDRAMIIRQ